VTRTKDLFSNCCADVRTSSRLCVLSLFVYARNSSFLSIAHLKLIFSIFRIDLILAKFSGEVGRCHVNGSIRTPNRVCLLYKQTPYALPLNIYNRSPSFKSTPVLWVQVLLLDYKLPFL
jgi:hypothetical protein